MNRVQNSGRAFLLLGLIGLEACAGHPRPEPPSELEIVNAVRAGVDKLGSGECEDRRRAIGRLSNLPTIEMTLQALERELAGASPAVKRKGLLLLEEERLLKAYISSERAEIRDWMENTRGRWTAVYQGSKSRQQERAKALIRDMLAVVKDASYDPLRRRLAMVTLMDLSVEGGGGFGTGITYSTRNGLPGEIMALLEDASPDVRGRAAAEASKVTTLSLDEQGLVISLLIEALRHPHFLTREAALSGLRKRTGEWFCVDPTDEPSESDSGIREWEERWVAASPVGASSTHGKQAKIDRPKGDFVGANLRGADLQGADLRGVELRRADLEGANLAGANLWRAKLWGANLRGADLRGAVLRWTLLDGRITNLEEANLERADLGAAKLKLTVLRRANLRAAILRASNLWAADLTGADLGGTDLRKADLTGANLQDAALQKANLQGAKLDDADLKGADLRDADLRGLDLGGAKNLTLEQVRVAVTDGKTRLPAYLDVSPVTKD